MNAGIPLDAIHRGLGILAASMGALVGGIAIGALALLGAKAVGLDESLGDYGLRYQLLLGGAWLGAALGCGLALRLTRQRSALTASVILFLLLAPPGLLAAVGTNSGSGWPSTWEWAAGLMLYVILPLTAPAIGFLLAEALTREQSAP